MTQSNFAIRLPSIALAVALLAGCSSKTYLMPTPNAYTHPEWNPFAEVPAALQSDSVSVMYVTDRVPTKQAADHWEYGYDRSRSASFGDSVVQIGQNQSWDDIVAASRTNNRAKKFEIAITSTNEIARFQDTPPTLFVSDDQLATEHISDASQLQIDAEKQFHEDLTRRLALTPRKEVFIFVHGFNDTFDYAVLTTAQLWHFLGREGVPLCYTWPAGEGLLKAYEYTLESTDFTVYHFKQILRMIASHPEVKKINIIAHSRGTAVLTDTLREMYLEVRDQGDEHIKAMKFGNVVLAAADLELDVVLQRDATERVSRAVDHAAIYFSDHDKALGLSEWLFGGFMRLGDVDFKMFSPEELEVIRSMNRVQLIKAKVKDLGDFNHAYFHTSPAVSSDIVLYMRLRLLPGAQHGRPLQVADEGYWIITDGYPGADWSLPQHAGNN